MKLSITYKNIQRSVEGDFELSASRGDWLHFHSQLTRVVDKGGPLNEAVTIQVYDPHRCIEVMAWDEGREE